MSAAAMALLKSRAAEVAELLRQLANPNRLLLLCQISAGERPVSQLEAETGMRQPGLSQQLAELRQAGLVTTRKVSRQVYYRIADTRAEQLLHSLHALYCASPAAEAARFAPDQPVPVATPRATGAALPAADAARFARIGD